MTRDYSNVPVTKTITNNSEEDIALVLRNKGVEITVTIKAGETLTTLVEDSSSLAQVTKQIEQLNKLIGKELIVTEDVESEDTDDTEDPDTGDTGDTGDTEDPGTEVEDITAETLEITDSYVISEGQTVTITAALTGSGTIVNSGTLIVNGDEVDTENLTIENTETGTVEATVSTIDGLKAMTAWDTDVEITLTDNVEIEGTLDVTGDTIIDLSNNTLTYTNTNSSETATIVSGEETTLTLANGTIDTGTAFKDNVAVFAAEGGSSLVLENIVANGSGAFVYPKQDTTSVTIKGCKLTTNGGYCLATNAATTENGGVIITVEDSELTATDGPGSCGMMVNVDANVTITNSTITGDEQGLLVRAGTATVTDSKLVVDGSYYDGANQFTTKWGSGNATPGAALVVGNQTNSSYVPDAIVTIENTTLTVGDNYSEFIPQVYAASGANKCTTNVSGVEDTSTIVVKVSDGYTVTVNDKSVADTSDAITTVAELEEVVA